MAENLEELGARYLIEKVYRGFVNPSESLDPRLCRAVGELLVQRGIPDGKREAMRLQEAILWATEILTKLRDQLPLPVEARKKISRDAQQCLLAFLKREEYTRSSIESVIRALSADNPRLKGTQDGTTEAVARS
jgi:hypothetical protein